MIFSFLKALFYFIIKREVYYHKIQYSKVFKHDIAAAVLGITIGAFVAYLSLSSVGSGSPDLSDLSLLFWYIFLILSVLYLRFFILNNKKIYIVILTYNLYFFLIYNILV